MTIVVLLILAGVWGVVLYGYVKDRLADVRPADSIGTFRRQLSILERTGPEARIPAARSLDQIPAFRPVPAARRYRVSSGAQRRRSIVFGLLVMMGGSLLLGFVPALRVMWGLHLVLDAVFGAYIFLLARRRGLAIERAAKVRDVRQAYLSRPTPASEPALLLRRTGS